MPLSRTVPAGLLLVLIGCAGLGTAALEAPPAPAPDGPLAKPDPVGDGLRFLLRHQRAFGNWNPRDYRIECHDTVDIEEEALPRWSDATIACTALALACFLQAGHVPEQDGPYRELLHNGLDWLLRQQQDSGAIGRRTRAHGMATWALALAYRRNPLKTLRKPLTGAIEVSLERQAVGVDGQRFGWNELEADACANDSAIGRWHLLALATAADAGMRVLAQLKETQWYVVGARRAMVDGDARERARVFPGTWDGRSNAVDHSYDSDSKAGTGLLLTVLTGADPRHDLFAGLPLAALQLARQAVRAQAYPGQELLGLALAWDRWHDPGAAAALAAIRRRVARHQYRGAGCLYGSWDGSADGSDHDLLEGRLFATVIALLILTAEPAPAPAQAPEQ